MSLSKWHICQGRISSPLSRKGETLIQEPFCHLKEDHFELEGIFSTHQTDTKFRSCTDLWKKGIIILQLWSYTIGCPLTLYFCFYHDWRPWFYFLTHCLLSSTVSVLLLPKPSFSAALFTDLFICCPKINLTSGKHSFQHVELSSLLCKISAYHINCLRSSWSPQLRQNQSFINYHCPPNLCAAMHNGYRPQAHVWSQDLQLLVSLKRWHSLFTSCVETAASSSSLIQHQLLWSHRIIIRAFESPVIKLAADSPSWNSPTTTPLTSVWHQSISCLNFTASSVVKLVSIMNISAITAAGSCRSGIWGCQASARFQLPLSSKRSYLTPFLQFVRIKDYLVLGSLQPFSREGWWNKPTLSTPIRASIRMQFIIFTCCFIAPSSLDYVIITSTFQENQFAILLFYFFSL